MNINEKFQKLRKRCIYRWWILPVYALVYFILFTILEDRVSASSNYHVISTPIDHMIPFCEYFIIPYYLWFAFIMGTCVFFILVNRDRKEYERFEITMISGMSVFLLISWIYPNGLLLRPSVFPRDNIFTRMVQALYRSDTPTNVFPSMHIYNSLCACEALISCKMLRDKKWITISVKILTLLIVLSTVFLKQHSVLDVIGAVVLFFVVYQLVYRPVWIGSADTKNKPSIQAE
ncbi:MAG: phosphatase PAP2 family protein [Bilifractor sp.]|jgi:membrane-associated phospholipid phosphatase